MSSFFRNYYVIVFVSYHTHIVCLCPCFIESKKGCCFEIRIIELVCCKSGHVDAPFIQRLLDIPISKKYRCLLMMCAYTSSFHHHNLQGLSTKAMKQRIIASKLANNVSIKCVKLKNKEGDFVWFLCIYQHQYQLKDNTCQVTTPIGIAEECFHKRAEANSSSPLAYIICSITIILVYNLG